MPAMEDAGCSDGAAPPPPPPRGRGGSIGVAPVHVPLGSAAVNGEMVQAMEKGFGDQDFSAVIEGINKE